MAGSQRRLADTLESRLKSKPERFDFFELVRVLSWPRGGRDAGVPANAGESGLTRILGGELDPSREPVLFRNAPGLTFPWSAVMPRACAVLGQASEELETGQIEIVAALMGLTGASGVLPEHYTELLIELSRDKNSAVGRVAAERESSLQAFVDALSHRSVSFFYRSWAKYRLPVNWEQGRISCERSHDPITTALRSFAGLGPPKLSGRLGLNENFPLFFSGHYARRTPTVAALKQLLRQCLGFAADVEEFHGRWLTLAQPQQTRLSSERGKVGQHHRLGRDAIAGDRIWDVNGAFRIRVGPVDQHQFLALMPEGAWLQEVFRIVRLFVGPQFAFDIQIVLKAEAVPPPRLRKSGAPLRLKRNAWLWKPTTMRNPDDAVFRCG
jgi:type VI secretion system protein ImpH